MKRKSDYQANRRHDNQGRSLSEPYERSTSGSGQTNGLQMQQQHAIDAELRRLHDEMQTSASGIEKKKDWSNVLKILKQHPELARYEIRTADNKWTTLLHLAMKANGKSNTEKDIQQQVFDFILTNSPETAKIKNSNGNLPIHCLCSIGQSRTLDDKLHNLKRLVEAFPAACTIKGFNGQTPLHILPKADPNLARVQFLLRVAPEALAMRDDHGKLPIDVAREKAKKGRLCKDLLDLLEESTKSIASSVTFAGRHDDGVEMSEDGSLHSDVDDGEDYETFDQRDRDETLLAPAGGADKQPLRDARLHLFEGTNMRSRPQQSLDCAPVQPDALDDIFSMSSSGGSDSGSDDESWSSTLDNAVASRPLQRRQPSKVYRTHPHSLNVNLDEILPAALNAVLGPWDGDPLPHPNAPNYEDGKPAASENQQTLAPQAQSQPSQRPRRGTDLGVSIVRNTPPLEEDMLFGETTAAIGVDAAATSTATFNSSSSTLETVAKRIRQRNISEAKIDRRNASAYKKRRLAPVHLTPPFGLGNMGSDHGCALPASLPTIATEALPGSAPVAASEATQTSPKRATGSFDVVTVSKPNKPADMVPSRRLGSMRNGSETTTGIPNSTSDNHPTGKACTGAATERPSSSSSVVVPPVTLTLTTANNPTEQDLLAPSIAANSVPAKSHPTHAVDDSSTSRDDECRFWQDYPACEKVLYDHMGQYCQCLMLHYSATSLEILDNVLVHAIRKVADDSGLTLHPNNVTDTQLRDSIHSFYESRLQQALDHLNVSNREREPTEKHYNEPNSMSLPMSEKHTPTASSALSKVESNEKNQPPEGTKTASETEQPKTFASTSSPSKPGADDSGLSPTPIQIDQSSNKPTPPGKDASEAIAASSLTGTSKLSHTMDEDVSSFHEAEPERRPPQVHSTPPRRVLGSLHNASPSRPDPAMLLQPSVTEVPEEMAPKESPVGVTLNDQSPTAQYDGDGVDSAPATSLWACFDSEEDEPTFV